MQKPWWFDKTLVLVGLMGSGKSRIGWHLAQHLNRDFIDADQEIEKAAGCSISDIFQLYGEVDFRKAESKIIQRLIRDHSAHVLATGGGAFVHDETRTFILDEAIAIWLRADIDTLYRRVHHRNHRPLLDNESDISQKLEKLLTERIPFYSQAPVIVDNNGNNPQQTLVDIIDALKKMKPC